MANIFKKLIPIDDLKATVKRFPYSAVCSFALFTLILLSIHDVIEIKDKINVYGRLMVLSVYGFFWFGLARLIAEGLAWETKKERLLAYGVFAVLAAFVFFGSGFLLAWFLFLMIPALLLGISVGPYIKSGDNLSLWFYNRQTWQGGAISIIAGLLWGAGISAILASVDYLFGVNVEGEIYGDVWAFALIVFAPLYALAWVPTKYSYTEADCHAPPQLSFILNWVLAPLVIIYMAILYAYFVKIALVGELPRGQLSYMITAFGGVGVLTYLAGWPLRENGAPTLKLIYKLFFPALIVPVGMQALSIYLRIDQYGVTEQRYIVALSTVWFAILAVSYTFKKPALKFIPGILAVMLLVAALGPLSAPNVAMSSQMGRLEALLTENKILVAGKIQKVEEQPTFEDRKSISSILDFIRDRKELERIEDWMSADLKAKVFEKKYHNITALTEAMGFSYVSNYQRKQNSQIDNVNLNPKRHQRALDVAGYDLYVDRQYVNLYTARRDKKGPDEKWWKMADKDEDDLFGYYQNDMLVIGVEGRGQVSFDVEEYALGKMGKQPEGGWILEMEERSGDLRVKIVFNNINLRRDLSEDDENTPYKLNGFNFKTLIDY